MATIRKIKSQISKVRSVIYTDYAHHPTEIKATLQALREKYPKKKIVCVFQPHQQDRLNRLFKEFTTAFKTADKTIIYPLYKVKGRDSRIGLPSGDLPKAEKSSVDLVKTINKPNVFYADDFKSVSDLIKQDIKSDSIIVFMSAGDLDLQVRRYFCK